jgi:putative flippase GtrA
VARYAGVGVVVTLIDYVVFLLGMQWGLSAPLANVLSKLAATLAGAVLHRRYTFAGPQRLGPARQMLFYAALSLFNLGLSTGLIVVLSSMLGWPGLVAKLLADVVVIAVSFVVSRVFIYAPARP